MEPGKEIGKEPKGGPSTPSSASKKAAGNKPGDSEASSPPSQAAQGQSTAGNGGDQDLLQHAKQATGEIVNQVQQQASSQLTRGKESAASELSTVVNAVRRFGETLNAEGNGPIARYAAEYGDKAAQNLERLSTYIREQDPKKVLNDVQNFGRRQPALFLGGAFLLGFAGARLIKSSMDADARSSMNRGAQGAMTTGMNTGANTGMNAGAPRPLNTGAGQQSLNTNPGATPPSPTPNRM